MQKFVPGSLSSLSNTKGVSVDNFKAGFVAKKPNVSLPENLDSLKKQTPSTNQNNDFKPFEKPKAKEEVIPEVHAPKEKTYLEKDLQESRTKGYEDGYSKGFAAAKQDSDDINKKIMENLKAVEQQLSRINVEKRTYDESLTKNIYDLSYKIAQKISEISLTENHVKEIEKTIEQTLQILFSEPKITINVNDKVANLISEKLPSIKSGTGFLGEVEVAPDSNLSNGSCNISWQNGGATHDKQEIWSQISDIIKNVGK